MYNKTDLKNKLCEKIENKNEYKEIEKIMEELKCVKSF